jgi:hypothetical protein
VFPKVKDYLAWETEGLLLACWLVLQDHDHVQDINEATTHLEIECPDYI